MDDGIFTVRARRCLRCGRLLTSREALERGYGCQCMLKAGVSGAGADAAPEEEPIRGQMTIFDIIGKEEMEEPENGSTEPAYES